MNARRVHTIAIPTLSAPTRSDHLHALAMSATAEMALLARVSRICRRVVILCFPKVYTFLGTTCPLLESLQHGSVSSETNMCGESVTFECNDGYRLSGSSSRQCGTDLLWSGTKPICNGKT